ncbi:MAG: molybdopterin-dependent oxidoreductase [Deltaproteobacteria bacterium]|nr:molybdopterin-dependent oxidoreductase [Deltaproteobacteria bacterium]
MKTKELARRDLFKLGALSAVALTGLKLNKAEAGVLRGKMDALQWGFKDISPTTRKERKAVPSACWQCVTRDGIVAYVENGRLMKIEGNTKLPRTNGVLCARGQGGVGQVYDPDRLLYPMKRVGPRGGGKWKRISWDEAKREFVSMMKKLKDEGHPEKFMLHYGRMKDTTSTIVTKYFLPAYGSGTKAGHTSICEGSKWVGQELTWGKHYDMWDVKNTNMVLNFGSNVFEAHTNHVPVAQRLVEGMARGAKLYTFDVRLSNTAARSTEWIPIKSGTDTAVILAMAHVIVEEGLYDEKFITKWTNVTVQQLKDHLKKFTPEWAEKESGVSASKIRSLAIAFAKAKPGVAISYRGLVAHYGGANNERALIMLNAICGYINVPGGYCQPVGAKWKDPFKKAFGKKYSKKPKKLDVSNGYKGQVAYPTHGACQDVLGVIREGKAGRPDVYFVYCYNPPYVNGDCQDNINILKDESIIPHLVVYDVAYSEIGSLGDLVFPAATYLERWDAMGHASGDQIHEYFIRQPVVKPLGETKPLTEFLCEIAPELGIELPFKNHEELVKTYCNSTPGVKEAGGFEYMLKHGAWYDPNEKPHYHQQEKKLKEKDLKRTKVDEKTGVIYKPSKKQAGYDTKKGSNYVGQMIDGVAYKGFKPDKIDRGSGGKLAIYSEPLKKKGWNPIPTYYPVPEHQKMSDDELILTTYKVRTQTHSRTQNCKFLTEDFHANPALINPKTAAKFGIKNGDKIEVSSSIGKIMTRAKVTNGVHPSAISISYHCGHWEYGRYASGNKAPFGRDDDKDLNFKWWKDKGEHPNWIIPNSTDPIGGQQRWMDTVVKVRKV